MTQPIPFPADPRAKAPGGSAPAKTGRVIPGAFGPRRPIRLAPEEREFLPAALEVIETPASPTLRLTALAICGLCTVAVAWASLAHIDMVAVASGKVIPLGQVKVVQPLETAMIRAIHVDEGDHVTAGQLLVDLDPTEAQADLDSLVYDATQAALDAEVARILLTLDPAEASRLRAPDGADPILVAQGREQARSEIGKHLAALAEIEADFAEKRAGRAANDAQIERARLSLPLVDERYQTAKGLFEKHFGTLQAVRDAEQQLVEKRAELRGAEANAYEIDAEMRALQAKAEETRAGFVADATDRRTKALQKLAGLTQQITKARQKESYRRLAAPVDGTIQGVKIHTPGAVVTTADTLMTVVPDGAGVEVDALVQNGDIGFVQEGQEVELKLDAFPFTHYGLVKGRLRKLGRDAVAGGPIAAPAVGPAGAPGAAASTASGTEMSYPARVSLDQDWILVDGRREAIRPGMRVSAEIKTGDRRVIEYLLSPVVQAVQEAGRER